MDQEPTLHALARLRAAADQTRSGLADDALEQWRGAEQPHI